MSISFPKSIKGCKARHGIFYTTTALIEAGVPFLNPYPANTQTKIVVAGKAQQVIDHLSENLEEYRYRVEQRL
jgi:hypothetical protein